MFIQQYEIGELNFAYQYHAYLRFRISLGKPHPLLQELDRDILNTLVREHQLRILECSSDPIEILALVSLQPTESISGCASKLKGRVSKWLNRSHEFESPSHVLSRGYFACTSGKSTSEAVENYLEEQSDHHGYAKRILPPVHAQKYQLTEADVSRINPKHAMVVSQFHLVMATAGRRGFFGSQEGRAVAEAWLETQGKLRIRLIKVSFVPDHVHVALRAHPAVAPAEVVVALMNRAQDILMPSLIPARLERLWQPSAYIGSYGELASPQIRRYMENWSKN
jgi:REP element-mobilizing transposase RayT